MQLACGVVPYQLCEFFFSSSQVHIIVNTYRTASVVGCERILSHLLSFAFHHLWSGLCFNTNAHTTLVSVVILAFLKDYIDNYEYCWHPLISYIFFVMDC